MTVTRPDTGAAVSDGKALLETAELIFRGDFRLRIPFARVSTVEAADGVLRIGWSEGEAFFELGTNAGKWAAKISHPPSLLDKLGVKPGMTISVIGLPDEGFIQQLRSRVGDLMLGRPAPGSDLVLYEADEPAALAALPSLRSAIKPGGAVWVISPKGKGAPIRDVDVIAAAREAGLVDVKVASFSNTHTAAKLVIPVAQRPKSTVTPA